MKLCLLYMGKKGAGPIYSFEMARHLADKNIQLLCVLSSMIENIDKWKELQSTYSNVNLFVYQTYSTRIEFFLSLFKLNVFRKIVNVINAFNPNCLYVPMPFMWEYFIVPFVKNNVLKIRTVHDVIAHTGEYQTFFQFKTNLAYKFYDRFIILSETFRTNLLSHGVDSECIAHIPHANFSYYLSDDVRLNNQPNNVIGFFGTISKYKGIDDLLCAFLDIRHKYPNVKLLIAGSGNLTPYESLLESMKDDVILYNKWISDEEVEKIISYVDFLVLPYKDASQSGVIPLANSFAKPVIATDVGGLHEQVSDETGLIIPPNNHLELVNAIAYFIEHYDIVREKGMKAKQKMESQYTWDKSVDDLLRFLSK